MIYTLKNGDFPYVSLPNGSNYIANTIFWNVNPGVTLPSSDYLLLKRCPRINSQGVDSNTRKPGLTLSQDAMPFYPTLISSDNTPYIKVTTLCWSIDCGAEITYIYIHILIYVHHFDGSIPWVLMPQSTILTYFNQRKYINISTESPCYPIISIIWLTLLSLWIQTLSEKVLNRLNHTSSNS
jgi:hypothetical protein